MTESKVEEAERVLKLGASDFILVVLVALAVFYTLPKILYRNLKKTPTREFAKIE